MRVTLEGITKSFGSVVAVRDFSLTIEHGEFVVLLGPSGCGKTTILRMLAGLEEPDDGRILMDSQVVNDWTPRQRDVAMVFQNYALYPHMTVEQNLEYPLKLRGIRPPERKKKVRETAKLLGIGELLHRRPRELSGGQRQRVALGRAMVRQPKIFLMDEPLSNLDAKLRVQMRGEIKRLQKELGVTAVYVTHDQAEAMTMADRIAVIRNGVLQQCSGPEEIYHRPRNLFVAGFVGSPAMNFIQARLAGEKMEIADHEFKVPEAWRAWLVGMASETGKPDFLIGVRPEDVVIKDRRAPGASGEEEGFAPGTVFISEPLGDVTFVTVELGKTRIVARAGGQFRAEMGQRIWVNPIGPRAHLFNPTTGLRL